MKIGNLDFPVPVFLAPMAGVTDTPYRILAHEMGCPLSFAEMVSALGINFRNDKTLEMLKAVPEEGPIALQLFGCQPESVARAAEYVESLGLFAVIDFNMGCPAPKVVKNGSGSALLKDLPKAEAVLKALRRATKLPVTVKMRLGWDKDRTTAQELARIAEAAGVDAIAVHGRTREEYYSGHADWEAIAKVKQSVRIPVIANGDVRTCSDLKRIMEITGADGVMIGRGAQGNPWIFARLSHYYRTGEELPPPTLTQRAHIVLRHLDMLIRFKGDYIGIREMRKHATWYTRGLPGGAVMRNAFNNACTREEFSAIVDEFLLSPCNMADKAGSSVYEKALLKGDLI